MERQGADVSRGGMGAQGQDEVGAVVVLVEPAHGVRRAAISMLPLRMVSDEPG